MAALPQWNLEPPISSHSSLPWRVIWPYRPIIETFGHTSKGLDDEDLFKYPGALPADIQEALPSVLAPYSDFIVVEASHRIIVFHSLTAIRHRCANFIMPRLRQPLTPYFHSLTTRTESSELPTLFTSLTGKTMQRNGTLPFHLLPSQLLQLRLPPSLTVRLSPDTPMPQAEPDTTALGSTSTSVAPSVAITAAPHPSPTAMSPPLPAATASFSVAPASPPDVPTTEVKYGPAINEAEVGTPLTAATITSLRPMIHPSVEIDPTRSQLPAPLRPPPLHHIFAEAFSRLPSLLSIWGNIVEESGRALYHYLLPEVAEPTLDVPIEANPRRREETIFSQMVSAYVDIPSSFEDPHRLSAPQVPADDTPISSFPPTNLSPTPFDPLVRHLHSQLQAHFVKLRADNVLHPHVTFIVGPPSHPNARYSLHSHLVGCYTSPYGYPSEYHTVLYVPTGPGQVWTGPAEWGPLMVYLAASFLWPDLSFLVVSPSIMLVAHASYEELQQIFDTTAALYSALLLRYFHRS